VRHDNYLVSMIYIGFKLCGNSIRNGFIYYQTACIWPTGTFDFHKNTHTHSTKFSHWFTLWWDGKQFATSQKFFFRYNCTRISPNAV